MNKNFKYVFVTLSLTSKFIVQLTKCHSDFAALMLVPYRSSVRPTLTLLSDFVIQQNMKVVNLGYIHSFFSYGTMFWAVSKKEYISIFSSAKVVY